MINKNCTNRITNSFFSIIILFILITITLPIFASSQVISFSGYDWQVKTGENRGPGPNNWLSNKNSVWVDDQEQLHLKIINIDDKWYCSEVWLNSYLGYGTYEFITNGLVDNLNENTVVGLFVYEADDKEIDIEFSRWGDKEASHNLHYSVQQYWINPETNEKSFYFTSEDDTTINSFVWLPESIKFKTEQNENIIAEWDYIGADNFAPGNERVHINFWLLGGTPPTDNREQELIVKKFSFFSQDSIIEEPISDENTVIVPDTNTPTDENIITEPEEEPKISTSSRSGGGGGTSKNNITYITSKEELEKTATIIEQIIIKQDQPVTTITADTKDKNNTTNEITKSPTTELQNKLLEILNKHNKAGIMALFNKIIELFAGYLV